MTKDELIEQLAAIEHQRWSDWQKWMHRSCSGPPPLPQSGVPDGALIIGPALVDRWERQIRTPYAELSPGEQLSDIEQVMRYWPLIVKFVETWIREHGDPDYLADAWMDDMGTREVMAAIREMGS